MNPIDFDPFNMDSWMEEYAALQDRQRAMQLADNMPAGQEGFEQQLNELQLGSSGESAAEADRKKHSNNRGWWSHIKSGAGKAIKSMSGKKSSGASASYEVSSVLRIDFAKRGREIEPNDQDEELISRFRRAGHDSVSDRTVQRNASILRNFSAWLNASGRPLMTDRLNGPDLDEDVAAYAQEVDPADSQHIMARTTEAVRKLRLADLPPPDGDSILISRLSRAVESAGRSRHTVAGWSGDLRKFSGWLRSRNHTLSSLLDNPNELNRLAVLYESDSDREKVRAALKILLEFHGANVQGRAANFNLNARQRVASRGDDIPHVSGPQRLHAEDVALMEKFGRAARQLGIPENTIKNNLVNARRFAKWLFNNNKRPLEPRLRSEALADDILEYRGQNHDPDNRLQSTLTNFRRLATEGEEIVYLGPGRRVMGHRTLNPYPQDERLVDAVADEALRNLGAGATKQKKLIIQKLASIERRFSDWLQREGRQSVIDGLTGGQQPYEQLLQDIEDFKNAIGRDARELNFGRHQKYLRLVDANAALGVAPPEHADWGRPPAESGVQSCDQESLWQQLEQAEWQEPAGFTSTWSPQLPSDFDPNMWLTAEAASPSSVRGSSDIYAGLDSLVELPPTPRQLRDDAHSMPLLGPAEPPFVDPSGVPPMPQDIGYLVGEEWQHGSQLVSNVLIDVLDNLNLMPTQFTGARQVSIDGELYWVTLGPRGRADARFVHDPRTSSAAGPSYQPVHHHAGSSAGGASRQPLPDIGPLIRGGWEHRERWLPDHLIAMLESERLLPSTGQPTHFYIHNAPYRAELLKTNRGSRVRLYPQDPSGV